MPLPIKHPHWLLALALLAAYANSFGGSFQFDDYNVIVFRDTVHSWAALSADFGIGIRPLLKLSYWLCWVLGGGESWPFHVFNFGVHTLNTLLVFVLTQRLALWYGQAPPAHYAATVAALAFALHPANTEAVSYICGRSTSLMTLFYLCSLLAYDQHLRSRQRRWLCFSFLAFVAALTTKEVAATLPVALLLWDRLAQPNTGAWSALRRHLPFWTLLMLGVAAITVTKYDQFFAVSLLTRDLWRNALSQVNGLYWLLGEGLALRHPNIDPDLPVLDVVTADVVARGGLLILLLLLALKLGRTRPWLPFVMAWAVLHFLPTNSLLPRLDVANDRQWYLPGLGAAWILAFGSAELSRRWPRAAPAAGAALLLVFAYGTHLRNRDYANELTLWSRTAQQSPQKARVLNNLGVALHQVQRHDEAWALFMAAHLIDPSYGPANHNLGRKPDATAAPSRNNPSPAALY